MNCSICINTFRRPELLKKLLDSLNNQEYDETINLEIIIVDNDIDLLGKQIVEEAAKYNKIPIRYFSQPIKNISITRNKAISEARGEYMFFIDDDEYADPKWIISSINCLKKFNADAVFGSVLSYFEDMTPYWIKKNKMFHRQIQKTGSKPKFPRSGNCLIKSSLLKSIDGPFDVQYGVTGGSDSHLFAILANNGAKFVYCQESMVYEYVPLERANLIWLFKRSLRTGNSFARRSIELSSFKFSLKIYLLLKALILGLLNLFFSFITIFSKKVSSEFLIKSAGYLGHIGAIFSYHQKEYK